MLAETNDALWAAIAAEGFREDLRREIDFRGLKPLAEFGDLFLFSGELVDLAWARVRWLKAERVSFSSITDGAKKLKSRAKRWEFFTCAGFHRRGTLIQDQLRSYRLKEANFPTCAEECGDVGVFTLIENTELLIGLEFDRPDPLGRVCFRENKEEAPSRAYLKLWEAFYLEGKWPEPGTKCLELGASPGGWTWVIASLGANVLAFDRAPLDPKVAAMPGVESRIGDAFSATPTMVGEVDWLFSDLICYPEKLLQFINTWIEAEAANRMICTIKFQGEADPAIIAEFQKLGRVRHLHHNKHELTWLRES